MDDYDVNYEQDTAIDKNRLDDEIIRQPQLMLRYALIHAQRKLDRDRAKQALDVLRATLDAEIRAEARDKKPTEAAIDAAITRNPNFIKKVEELQQAEYELNVAFAASMAINSKRPCLEDLVRLHMAGYWAEPRTKGDGVRESTASILRNDVIRHPTPISLNEG